MKPLLCLVAVLIGVAGVFGTVIGTPSHVTRQGGDVALVQNGTTELRTNETHTVNDQMLEVVDTKGDERLTEGSLTAGLPDNVGELIDSLERLHVVSVCAFEKAPGFGANRGGVPAENYSDFMTVPRWHLPNLIEIKWGRKSEPQRVQEQADDETLQGYAAWKWLTLLRGVTKSGLVYDEADLLFKQTFGHPWKKDGEDRKRWIVGMPSISESIDRATDRLQMHSTALSESERFWKSDLMQLVSLLQHNPPVVYESNMKIRSGNWSRGPLVTRPLEDFEKASLERLQAGAARVIGWDQKDDCLTMVGAIRAKESCLKCHEEKRTGDLLGAFTYRIKEEIKSE